MTEPTDHADDNDLWLWKLVGPFGQLFGAATAERCVDRVDREPTAGQIDVGLEQHDVFELGDERTRDIFDALGKFVVGDSEKPELRWGEVLYPNAGYHCHAQQLDGIDPTLAGYDAVILVDQDGDEETELADAAGQPLELTKRPLANLPWAESKIASATISTLIGTPTTLLPCWISSGDLWFM